MEKLKNYLIRDIPPELFWELKQLALDMRITLKALIIKALQEITKGPC